MHYGTAIVHLTGQADLYELWPVANFANVTGAELNACLAVAGTFQTQTGSKHVRVNAPKVNS